MSVATLATSLFSRLERAVPWRRPPRSAVFALLYTVALFLIFLVLTFPHDIVAQRVAERLAADSGWTIRYERVSLRPWEGYRFSNLRLIPPGKSDDSWIRARHVSFWPSLRALFGSDVVRLAFHGRAYDGEFSGSLDRGEISSVDLSWQDLRLAAVPSLTTLVAGNWEGLLSGDLRLAGKGDLRSLDGRVKLVLRNGALTAGDVRGFTIPDLHSTQADGEFEVKGGRLEIRSLKLASAELDVEARGQIFLRLPLADSIVNATLSVKPIPGANPGIEALLTLWNRNQRPPGGTYSFTLYGPLSAVKVR